MATFKSFEDIEAWRIARELTRSVYELSNKGNFARDFGLKDQIRKASVSIMSNIAEGFERNGNKEFRQFLATAKGSAGEVRAQLYVAFDQGYLDRPEFVRLSQSAAQVSMMLNGLMKYLQRSTLRGSKYRSSNLEP
jgi:four helix bundle protein